MENSSKQYGELIERIRKDRKLSREELCEGIMSKRNYQRFASGEVSIASDKLTLITDKLMLNTYSLQEIFKTYHQDEYLKLKKAYNSISQWNPIEGKRILASIDYDSISSKVNRQIYNLSDLMIKKNDEKIIDADYVDAIKSIIDYPNVLKRTILNTIELSALFIIMDFETKKNKSDVAAFFIELLNKSGETSYWLTSEIKTGICANISKGLYQLGKYEESLEYSNKGLQASKETLKFIGFINLLGYKLLALNKLGRFDDALQVSIRLYMHVLVEEDKNKIEYVKNVINSNLNIYIEEIVCIKKEV